MTKTFNVSIENPCSVPSIHVGCFTTTTTSIPSDLMLSSGPCCVNTYMHIPTRRHTYLLIIKIGAKSFLNAHIYLPERTLYYTQGSALVWECFSSFLLEKRMARENSGSACKFYFYNDLNPTSPYHKAEFPRHCGLS